MGNFDDNFRSTLTRQSWCFYSVGMVMIATRLYVHAPLLISFTLVKIPQLTDASSQIFKGKETRHHQLPN